MAAPSVHFEEFRFPIRLIYARNNRVDAKLYVDPSNRLVVKMENIVSPPDPYVMVMFQGDRYVSANGTNYLLTPSYEDMNLQGIVFRRRAETEPPRTTLGPNPWRERGAWSEVVPPLELARDREPEVSSRPEPAMLSFVPVVRIKIGRAHV